MITKVLSPQDLIYNIRYIFFYSVGVTVEAIILKDKNNCLRLQLVEDDGSYSFISVPVSYFAAMNFIYLI